MSNTVTNHPKGHDMYNHSIQASLNKPQIVYRVETQKKNTKVFKTDKLPRMSNIVQPHLSGLIGTASHPDMQKIRIIGFSFENRLH